MGQAERSKAKTKPKKIRITVVTTGRDLHVNPERDEPMQGVFDAAVALVGGQNQAGQFALEFDNQVLTELHRPIEAFAEQYGWDAEVELELVPAPEVI